jgi:hypothetical protein
MAMEPWRTAFLLALAVVLLPADARALSPSTPLRCVGFSPRHGTVYDGEIIKCLDAMRAAGVSQPLTSIDTWWGWCGRTAACAVSTLAAHVDWIGINVFPWWENGYSGILPCTTAEGSADFHIARMQQVMDRYPALPVMLTEFGWPGQP